MHKYALSLVPLMVALAGCAVGPDYQEPEAPLPERFVGADQVRPFDENAERRFWSGFDDPLLADLIDQALNANHDLRAALARYQRAEALLRGARREQLPSVTVNGSAAEQHLAEVERNAPGGAERVELYQAGVAAGWELDLFGRLRRATQAQAAELDAAEADLGALQVAMAGRIANSYFQLRGLQQQMQVARRNVENQQQALDIVQARMEDGSATRLDEARARAQLDAVRATVPQLQTAIRTYMYRIAVLTGRTPDSLVTTLAEPGDLPAQVPDLATGTPSGVLRRRPDIRAAERRVAAATARIGVATADLFPRFTLEGLIGSVASRDGDLFSGPAESRRIALGVDWTFLDFGKVHSRIDAADAETQAVIAEYQQTVLTALEETETQLVRHQRARERTELLRHATDAAQQAAELARLRYREGFIGFFEVLDSERELMDTRDAFIRSRTEVTLAMVDLYRALAGAPVTPEQDPARRSAAR
ncbi:Efflux transporter, outer membrane factor lipoprotein, NodT family [Alloalcanivorax dieselolei B5]|uniref:Efflux transporter, outer membrane factor lipoprotein, NodT family n=1 Tax=Alcanivorax dieselolei (strain DSM 16502 / CGMCC 1.3690 / MCCC 1A00001 / B-5) TaxID=930169 RepID=K0C696_ALCDB|nr:efflux transporter outer membrane subunit [Alloalcanivorax dieselolei]AFT68999.1 Efflux transporter, outer membrane factor lipoprotein, NodT family [Alloalcanivorax dieselolei B5]GGJ81758.1 RND transporter [Alloalcanivorax dieselolei]